jgi:phage terminase small subunit
MKQRIESPPAHLGEHSAAFWRRMVEDYDLDEAPARELLRLACEAMDRAEQARAQLDVDGLTITDRYGQVKPHPAASIEVQNRTAVARLLRELRVTDPPEEERVPRLGRVS